MVAAKHVSDFLSALRQLETGATPSGVERESAGASDTMALLLRTLASGDKTITELFENTKLDLGTLQVTFDNLQKMGLIERRERLWSLTDEGRQMAGLVG